MGRHGCSPSILLLALWLAARSRVLGGRPQGVRVPFFNRDVPGAGDVVGDLATQLVVPVGDLRGLGPDEVIQLVQECTVDAMDCLPVPFELVARELWGARDGSLRGLNRWLPFFSVDAAGGTVPRVLDDRPLRVLPDVPNPGFGSEVLVRREADGTTTVRLAWADLDVADARRLIAVTETFLAELPGAG
jgi:hypothetical protein